jgi:gliding motility-associated-like protein
LKKYFIFLFFLVITLPAIAKHIAGGEMSYVYLGVGTTPNSGKYRVTLKLYRDCDTDGAQLDPTSTITIYQLGSNSFFLNEKAPLEKTETVLLTRPDPCISNPPRICYQIGYYGTTVELPFISNGYVVSYQRCCRIDGIFNVVNSQNAGVTYTTNIPGTKDFANGPINSTPVFKASDTALVCANSPFAYDFGALDSDKDQLEFIFDEAYLGGSSGTPAPTQSTTPPYSPLTYNFGFSSSAPFGQNVVINPQTGMITGIAPVQGIYVITVSIVESRSGKVINVHRKDLHIKVTSCSIAAADLEPAYVTCDGLNLNFKNLSNSSLIVSYDWDFGEASSIDDVSNSAAPSYTYSVPGNYTVRLITNKGQNCSDTAFTIAKVFPGFKPDFTVQQSCLSVPYIFTDLSTTAFGTINNWKWDFGNTNATNDTARTSSASYIYGQKGSYTASLIVTNSIGCVDTVVKNIVVDDKPFLKVTNDTLICTLDNLQLLAQGTGTFKWSPNTNINNVNIANPIVRPTVPTRYTVTLTQAPGCINTASVFVDVKPFVSLDAGRDTTICLGDSIRLNPLSDGLIYKWSPTGTISNVNIKQPWAKPTGTTRYSVFATIGGCQANDGFVVTTVPYPLAYAGRDTSICFGDQAQLRATGGEQYLWYPANTLNNNTFQDPISTPYESTIYEVGVYENKGCPKPTYDSVLVSVVPPVKAFAGNDTAVVIGQPMQLLAFGGVQFQWTPSSFLNNPLIFNPIAKLNDDIVYVVKVSTKEGCFAYDTVKVKVYKTPPEIFIPTAFTPNGDGLNDNLIPIPVGIVKIVYFKVYNRYGEMVFTTEEIGKGWNGVYKGRDQGNESFVWHVLGIDYLGKPLFKKGQSTLIR